MSYAAIIPARGGSKGVPRKNLRKVGGVTLLERAIRSAQVREIQNVYVSTEDPEIRGAAERAGARTIKRPSELSQDDTPSISVLQHAVRDLKSRDAANHIVLLEPTSPFRTQEHVREAVMRYQEQSNNPARGSVVSVSALDRKPQNIFRKGHFLERYITEPKETFARRQDMKHLCRINSAIYITSCNMIERGTLLAHPLGWIEMGQLESINIDTELDLDFANFVVPRLEVPQKSEDFQPVDTFQGW